MLFGLAFLSVLVSDIAPPNHYRQLDDELDALRAQVYILMTAKYQIRSSAFIIANDKVALRGLALMRHRAKVDGVRSRIIGDALFNKLPRPMLRHLLDYGIEFRHHHPIIIPRQWSSLWTQRFWVLQRMHDKSVVADETAGKFGGRNAEVTYYDLGEKNYRDRDVLVGGPVLAPFNQYYDDLFESDHVVMPNLQRVLKRDVDLAEKQLDEAWEELQRTGILEQDFKPFTDADLHPAPLKILFDHVDGHIRDTSPMRKALSELVLSAREEFLFENPYLIPSQTGLQMLERAQQYGIRVRGLTSSAASNDGWLPSGGYLMIRPAIASRGVEIHEYQGPKALHAKSGVIDDKIAIIGSFNLDELSAYSNLELAVVSWDPKRAQELRASIEKDMENARLVTSGNPKVNNGLIEGLKDLEGLPLKKKLQIQCARGLAMLPAFRRHL